MEGVRSLLRIRVVKRFDAGNTEITNDLPHLHQSSWTTVGMQPGNPGNSTLGSFTIPLFAPGTEEFKAAKAIYDQLARYQRVEAYISHDGASLGRLEFAGVITGIRKSHGPNPVYELTGLSDTELANKSRPFPGELLSPDLTSNLIKSFLGTNELGWSDTFNPFTPANYTSTSLPSHTSGSWTSTTDDGLNVVTTTTGSGAVLLSQTGASAHDRWNTQYVEATGRLVPSTDTTNAGALGVGISASNANTNTSVVANVYAAQTNSSRYTLNLNIVSYSSGSVNKSQTIPNYLLNVDENGKIPVTIGLLVTTSGNPPGTSTATVTVNGRVATGQFPIGYATGTTNNYPFLFSGTPLSGSATTYLTNLVQYVRFTTDGSSTAAAFGNGTISAATHELPYGVDPGPSFLEVWTRLATREGWYWRYTPQAYVVGTRTLGTVDFEADPGVDRTASVIFSRATGNLVSLDFNNNADPLSADVALTGQSTPDGGGIAYWRDISTLGTYGVIQDEALGFTHPDFNSLRRAALQINKNKINLDTLGSKTAVVLRDPRYADTYRELDKITIHDPEMGCNYLACRIMARTFTENSPTETLLLDQFSDFIS